MKKVKSKDLLRYTILFLMSLTLVSSLEAKTTELDSSSFSFKKKTKSKTKNSVSNKKKIPYYERQIARSPNPQRHYKQSNGNSDEGAADLGSVSWFTNLRARMNLIKSQETARLITDAIQRRQESLRIPIPPNPPLQENFCALGDQLSLQDHSYKINLSSIINSSEHLGDIQIASFEGLDYIFISNTTFNNPRESYIEVYPIGELGDTLNCEGNQDLCDPLRLLRIEFPNSLSFGKRFIIHNNQLIVADAGFNGRNALDGERNSSGAIFFFDLDIILDNDPVTEPNLNEDRTVTLSHEFVLNGDLPNSISVLLGQRSATIGSSQNEDRSAFNEVEHLYRKNGLVAYQNQVIFRSGDANVLYIVNIDEINGLRRMNFNASPDSNDEISYKYIYRNADPNDFSYERFTLNFDILDLGQAGLFYILSQDNNILRLASLSGNSLDIAHPGQNDKVISFGEGLNQNLGIDLNQTSLNRFAANIKSIQVSDSVHSLAVTIPNRSRNGLNAVGSVLLINGNNLRDSILANQIVSGGQYNASYLVDNLNSKLIYGNQEEGRLGDYGVVVTESRIENQDLVSNIFISARNYNTPAWKNGNLDRVGSLMALCDQSFSELPGELNMPIPPSSSVEGIQVNSHLGDLLLEGSDHIAVRAYENNGSDVVLHIFER